MSFPCKYLKIVIAEYSHLMDELLQISEFQEQIVICYS